MILVIHSFPFSCVDEGEDAFGSDISFLYSCLRMHPLNGQFELPSFIKTTPYPHQHLALCWMLSREGRAVSQEEEDRIAKSSSAIHPLFVHLHDNSKYFFAPRTFFMTDVPMTNLVQRQGGVLCDMMGLGKTFEMLALILLHPREEGERALKGEALKGEEVKGEEGSMEALKGEEVKGEEGSMEALERIACGMRRKRKHGQEQPVAAITSVKRPTPSENTTQLTIPPATPPQTTNTTTLRPRERSFIEFIWTHLGMSVVNWGDAFNASSASNHRHQLEVVLNQDDSYEEKPSRSDDSAEQQPSLLCVDLSFLPVSPKYVVNTEGCCVRSG